MSTDHDVSVLIAASHPLPLAAVLPELLPLANLLAADAEWQRDASGVAALIMSCLGNVATAYQQRGDLVSAAILLEAAMRRQVPSCHG